MGHINCIFLVLSNTRAESGQKQLTFDKLFSDCPTMKQVAITSHYRHDGFLEIAAQRYKMFLGLFKDPGDGRFVPTLDIDLMWRIHQLHPHMYAVETTKINGQLLPNDDTLNDRTEGVELSQHWDATEKCWNEMHIQTISRIGGMFRGNDTAAERLLRSRLEGGVVDVVRSLPKCTGKSYTMKINPLQESAAKPPPDGGLKWVHMTDVGKALKAGC